MSFGQSFEEVNSLAAFLSLGNSFSWLISSDFEPNMQYCLTSLFVYVFGSHWIEIAQKFDKNLCNILMRNFKVEMFFKITVPTEVWTCFVDSNQLRIGGKLICWDGLVNWYAEMVFPLGFDPISYFYGKYTVIFIVLCCFVDQYHHLRQWGPPYANGDPPHQKVSISKFN